MSILIRHMEVRRSKLGKEIRSSAVYRLIKDFGLPTRLVAAVLNTNYRRIAEYYANAMLEDEGWLMRVKESWNVVNVVES